MRPHELTLKGFRSYRGETTFDFAGRRLVGIVGPIGAGKSSILDAVAFALYGKTPTYERDTKSLIHQQADACHVSLRFEVEGQHWRAVRALRRKGASGHQLQRLDPTDPTAPPLEDVQGEKPVRVRVEQLLGMDFNAFCRSVLLAQGRFADFLRATERERNEVLKGVFGYERFDAALEAAKRRVSAARLLLESLAREGGALAEARAALGLAQERLAAAASNLERFEAARAKVEAALEAGRAATARLAKARADADTLEKAAAALPDAVSIEATVTAALQGTEQLEGAAAAADDAEAARKDAEAAFAALTELVGDQSDFTELVRTHDRHVEAVRIAAEALTLAGTALETATTAALTATQAQHTAAASLETAEAGANLADAASAGARERLHVARHHDMARTLRAELAVGAACPVCEQAVTSVPKAGRAPAIARAEKALEAAHAAAAEARQRRQTAAADAAAVQERQAAAEAKVRELRESLRAGEAQLRGAEADLDAVKSEVIDRLGEGDPHARMQERQDMLAAGAAAREVATEQAAAAREQLERVREAGASAQRALTGLATKLATVWGVLGEMREVGGAPHELREAFVAIGEALLARHEETEREEAAAAADAEAASRDLTAQLDALDVEPGTDFTTALATVAAAHAGAQAEVGGLHATIEAGADIDARMAEGRETLEVATRLASDLQPSNFLAFLLHEERAALAELGSHHFEDLTNGGYRFTDDDAFDVLDLNAGGAERRSDSLSGGETFLASLALALALAEMVARGGGRLDALFLDEGFGSLDPEHLDRAMDGVGRLVAGDRARLVVLVSHVEQMRETIEDLIVLDKDDLTGDTVVVSGAVPA
jgi:exonuclease SbcC